MSIATKDQAAQAVDVLLELATDPSEQSHIRIEAAQAVVSAAYPFEPLPGDDG